MNFNQIKYGRNTTYITGSNRISQLIAAFKARVLADSGTYEGEANLLNQSLVAINSAGFVYVPSAFKSGRLYSLKPTDGSGDLIFSRNSLAYRNNASNVLEQMAANVGRIDYVNGVPTLLLEPISTNIILRSNEFTNGYWGASGPLTNRTPNSGASPEGLTNALKLAESNNSQEFKLFRNSVSGLANNTNYCISFFAKAAERSFCYVQNAAGTGARFDLQAGVWVGNRPVAPVNSGIRNEGNGWYRIWITLNTGAATAIIPEIGILLANNNTASYVGTSGNGILIYGAQFEQGTQPSSYIKTTDTTLTRIADFANKSGLSSSLGQTQGTIIFDFIYREPKTSVGGQLGITSSSGVINNCIVLWNNSTLNTIVLLLRANGVNVVNNISLGVVAYNTRYKIAIGYNSGDIVLYVNGVQVYTASTAFTFSELLDVIYLGTYDNSLEANINIYSLYAYQARLSNLELIARTT